MNYCRLFYIMHCYGQRFEYKIIVQSILRVAYSYSIIVQVGWDDPELESSVLGNCLRGWSKPRLSIQVFEAHKGSENSVEEFNQTLVSLFNSKQTIHQPVCLVWTTKFSMLVIDNLDRFTREIQICT